MNIGDIGYLASSQGVKTFTVTDASGGEYAGRKVGTAGIAWARDEDLHADKAMAMLDAAKQARKVCAERRKKIAELQTELDEYESLAANHLAEAQAILKAKAEGK